MPMAKPRMKSESAWAMLEKVMPKAAKSASAGMSRDKADQSSRT